MKIKIIGAQQARIHNIYKNIKLNLLKRNAAKWYNEKCRTQHLKPKYIRIKDSEIEDGTRAPKHVTAIIT
jgi:hypothetical protein